MVTNNSIIRAISRVQKQRAADIICTWYGWQDQVAVFQSGKFESSRSVPVPLLAVKLNRSSANKLEDFMEDTCTTFYHRLVSDRSPSWRKKE